MSSTARLGLLISEWNWLKLSKAFKVSLMVSLMVLYSFDLERMDDRDDTD